MALVAPSGLLALVSVILELTGHPRAAGSPLLLAMAFGALGWVALRRRKVRYAHHPSGAPGWTVWITPEGFRAREASRELRIARRDVRAGYAVPDATERGAHVILEGRRGPRVDVWVPTIEEARSLLEDLGVAPLARPMTFAFFFGLRVTVGADGVVVAWPLLGKRRFVPHDEITDVRWSADEVELVLADGGSYSIMTRASQTASSEQHLALLERLVSARAAYAASVGAEPVAALARGGRPASAWVRDLRAMSEAAGSQYRTTALPAETLWRVALDPAAKEELRIGASLALRAGLDAPGRARLRAAAEAAASPRVRVALTAAADLDDDATLATALTRRS
jgi:hypothetical protein